jgi:glutaredoxin-related protein
MKKYIVFILFLTLFVNMPLGAGLDNNMNLYYFYSDDCAPCTAVDDVIYVATANYPTVNVISISLDNEEAIETYNNFRIAFNVINDGYSTPFIAVGNDSFIGYSPDLEEELIESIKANIDVDGESLGDIAYNNPKKLTSDWYVDTYLNDVLVPEDEILDVYVFYTQHCDPCVDLITEIQSNEWNGTNFYLYKISDPNTVEGIHSHRMNTAFMNAFIQNEIGYPQIYIGNDKYIGYANGFITDIVNYYQQNGIGPGPTLADKVYHRYNDEIWSYANVYGEKAENDVYIEAENYDEYIEEKSINEDTGKMPFEDTTVENKAYKAMTSKNIGVYMFWGTMLLLALYLVYSRHIKS